MINEECLARILNGGAKYPFTEIQWQQLQHQVLSYKYIMAALPVPSDLVLFIKTSLHSSANRLLHQPPHPSIGCNYNFQMGYGRKIDPEPGRCRRTDGKKWRCSKEALPDAKYCERHMHRGRNRSRKPVEPIMATPLRSHPPAIPLIPSSSFTKTLNFSSFTETLTFSSSSSSSSSTTTVLSSQDHFLLESIPVRKGFGMKDQMGERSFFSESSGSNKNSMGGGSWQQGLVAFGSSSSSRQITKLSEYHQNAYSHKQKQQQQEDEGFYDEQLALKLERKDEPQKVMHHFFDDNNTETAATQLSIATPSCAARDFFHFHKHNEK